MLVDGELDGWGVLPKRNFAIFMRVLKRTMELLVCRRKRTKTWSVV